AAEAQRRRLTPGRPVERPAPSSATVRETNGVAVAAGAAPVAARPVTRKAKLSKDAYRRQRAAIDADLSRLGLRKSQLELAIGSPRGGGQLRRTGPGGGGRGGR